MQMSFDFSAAKPIGLTGIGHVNRAQIKDAKRLRGAMSYAAGNFAEDAVARHYCAKGYEVLARRWRGQGGEIDLILGYGSECVFVEVKQSRSFERAAERISRAQLSRIYVAAEEFIGARPLGSLTPTRFEAALVNGTGEIKVLQDLFAFHS